MHVDECFDLRGDDRQDQLTSQTSSGERFLRSRSSLEGGPAGGGGWRSPKEGGGGWRSPKAGQQGRTFTQRAEPAGRDLELQKGLKGGISA